VAAKKAAPTVAEPEGAPPFTWEPKAGGAPIVLPHASTAVPKGKMLKFFYEMNKRRNDFVGQITFAMQSAGVPVEVQDRVFDLDDDEAMELVNAWAAVLTGASLGES
jgi:hypothetical protein